MLKHKIQYVWNYYDLQPQINALVLSNDILHNKICSALRRVLAIYATFWLPALHNLISKCPFPNLSYNMQRTLRDKDPYDDMLPPPWLLYHVVMRFPQCCRNTCSRSAEVAFSLYSLSPGALFLPPLFEINFYKFGRRPRRYSWFPCSPNFARITNILPRQEQSGRVTNWFGYQNIKGAPVKTETKSSRAGRVPTRTKK